MLSLIPDMVERFEFNAQARTLLFHSFSFDLHVWEVYGSLSVGARLIVLPSVRDVSDIWSACQRQRISHISMTPSAFSWFSRHHAGQAKNVLSVKQPHTAALQELLPELKMIMLCGERLQFASLSVWFQTYERMQARPPRVINSYGITET
jgi:non-ribosomal peptide synthetase component F